MELPSDGSKIKCDLCQQIFQARKDKYKVHLRLEHDVEEENLKHYLDKKIFPPRQRNKKSIRCPNCGLNFQDKDVDVLKNRLQRHIKKCTKCKKKFQLKKAKKLNNQDGFPEIPDNIGDDKSEKMDITYDAISDVNDDREEILLSGSQISQQPIISVSKIGYLFFDGLVKKDDLKPTIGQFLKFVDNHHDLHDEDKKLLAAHYLQSFAKDDIKPILHRKWANLKQYLFDQYRCQLTLKEKIELRRHLIQGESEGVEDFHLRCQKAHFMLCDDDSDLIMEQDIVISFVSGLKDEVYEKIVQKEILSRLDLCLKYAIEIEQILPGNNIADANTSHFLNINTKEEEEEIIKVEVKQEQFYENVEEYDQFFDDQSFEEPNDNIIFNDEKTNDFKRQQKEFNVVDDDDSMSDNNYDDNAGDSDFEPTAEELKELEPKIDKTPKEHQCSLCSRSFKSDNNLKQHVVNAHEKKKKCTFCDLPFKSNLASHLKSKHPEHYRKERAKKELCDICLQAGKTKIRPRDPIELAFHKNIVVHFLKDPNDSSKLLCQICQSFSGKKDGLMVHIKMEHFNLTLPQCDVCLKYFSKIGLLNEHWRITTCKKDPVSCEHCGEKFPNGQFLRSHVLKEHYVKKNIQYPCHICGILSKSQANLRYHIEDVHKIGAKKIYCDQCGKEFTDNPVGLTRLKSHSEVHLRKTIKCTVEGCERMFGANRQLVRHIMSCHTTKASAKAKERNHICDQCSKAFNTAKQLICHKAAIHNGPKPYKCKECDYECAYSETMRQHVKSVHLNIMYNCIVPGCGKQMNEKGNMDKHMKTAHGIPLPSERNPHERIVVGDTPFKCELCEFRGENPLQITKHKAAAHEEEKIIKCDKCGKVYNHYKSLWRHKKKCFKQE